MGAEAGSVALVGVGLGWEKPTPDTVVPVKVGGRSVRACEHRGELPVTLCA